MVNRVCSYIQGDDVIHPQTSRDDIKLFFFKLSLPVWKFRSFWSYKVPNAWENELQSLIFAIPLF